MYKRSAPESPRLPEPAAGVWADASSDAPAWRCAPVLPWEPCPGAVPVRPRMFALPAPGAEACPPAAGAAGAADPPLGELLTPPAAAPVLEPPPVDPPPEDPPPPPPWPGPFNNAEPRIA